LHRKIEGIGRIAWIAVGNFEKWIVKNTISTNCIDQSFMNMLLKDAWHLEQFEKNKK
jgi:hypothetical protein